MDTIKAEETPAMPPTPPSRSAKFEDRLLDLVMGQFQDLKTAQAEGDDRIILAMKEGNDLRREQAEAMRQQQSYTNRLLLILVLGLLAKAGVDLAPILPFFHGG